MTWRRRLGAYLDGPRGHVALGVFLVTTGALNAERFPDDLAWRLMALLTIGMGAVLIGSAARDEGKP